VTKGMGNASGKTAVAALALTVVLGRVPAFASDPASDLTKQALEARQATTRVLSLDADPELGAYLGGECATCHQQAGATSGIPPIRALPVDYIVRALVEYRLGMRDNNVMKLMSVRLKDEEIAALAAYFSSFPE